MNRSFLLLPLVPAAAVAFACSSSSNSGGAQNGSDVPVVINGQATVAASGAGVDDVVVSPDRLTFPAATHADLLSKKPGDILVGNRSTAPANQNPFGYLRKVRSVSSSGGNVVVMTDRAYVNEIVRQGVFQGTLQAPQLTLTGPVPQSFGGDVHPLGNPTPLTLLDFSGKDIFRVSESVALVENPPKTIGFDAHATFTKATLQFTPKFDVGADIRLNLGDILGSVHEFHAIATGQLDADVEIDAAFTLTGNATGDDLAQLIAQKVFQRPSTTLVDYPINLGQLTVGPLNIPVNAEFKVGLACDFQFAGNVGVTVGGKASASVTAGFKYVSGGGVTPVWSHAQTFNQIGPSFSLGAAISAKCTLKPEFDLKFWDVAAAEIWAEPYVAMSGGASCDSAKLTGQVNGEAFAGVSATAHAKIDLFGFYSWEKSCTLFKVDSPHASFSTTFPIPGGTTASCTTPPLPPAPVNQDVPPASCFDGSDPPPTTTPPTSGADGGASTGDGGGGGTCNITPETPPSGWTCDPAKYGDCVCDCNCGANDRDCQTGQCGACDHDVCTEGTPLGTTCKADNQNGACIQSICANDSYCCEFTWSASCVAHITNGDFACMRRSCP